MAHLHLYSSFSLYAVIFLYKILVYATNFFEYNFSTLTLTILLNTYYGNNDTTTVIHRLDAAKLTEGS